MTITKCPDEFKDFLESCSLVELIMLIHDLDKYPEDANYLEAAQKRLSSLQKSLKEEVLS